ncbi:MAG: leucyl/phenylalanyl-tRNA--protein transferase [Halomonas sp.]|nr:leucyl/phenylalanyl-tRNA--protein transferase [Halomonas sp.]MCC5883466.1 leucyl/phenylalanyl-tRNA--protein transferase [Halomonas sp.]
MLSWLPAHPVRFPPVSEALREPPGLLAAGGGLTPEWLLAAYRHGIFPWYSDDQPILWWCPNPRMVLFPDELRITRSLTKKLRNGGFHVTFDRAFEAVVAACAAPRQGQPGTWITKEMHNAYMALQRLGYARSVEVWQADELVGGLYGVAMGSIFFGESMFSRTSDASKVALVHLVHAMRSGGGRMIDCQMHTRHLANLGARDIARSEFINYLESCLVAPGHGDDHYPLPCWALPEDPTRVHSLTAFT